MSYAVMPLSDYKTACDKIREKVDLTTVRFEETDFGYIRSAIFEAEESGEYVFTVEVKDESKLNIYSIYYAVPEWEDNSSPGMFNVIDGKTLSAYFTKGETVRIFISDYNGLKASDIVFATLSHNGEVVENFVAPPKIKSGELADKVEEVYEAGASDFGLKGKGQGELVHFENVHPIEHKVEVGLRSKNLVDMHNPDVKPTWDAFESIDNNTVRFYGCSGYANATLAYRVYAPVGTKVTISYEDELGGEATGRWYIVQPYGWSFQNGGAPTVPEQGYLDFTFSRSGGSGNNNLGWVDIKNLQVEIADTPTAYAPYIADFSDCKVYARGKNLLNLEGRTVVNFGASINTTKRTFFNEKAIILGLASNNYCNNATGGFEITQNTISCLQTATSYGIGFDVKLLPNTTYRFSSEERIGETVRLMEYDAEGNFIRNSFITNASATTTDRVAWGVVLFVNQTSGSEHYIKNPQLEYGSVITEYEPPITETEYTAASDGTVEGVKSISPTMNLSTDKAGAVINAECFLDPEAVITGLTNTVITLGGEV